jgi:hypothetical protein
MPVGMLSAKILSSSNLSHLASKVVLDILHDLTASIANVTSFNVLNCSVVQSGPTITMSFLSHISWCHAFLVYLFSI